MITVLKQYFKLRSALFFALDGFLIYLSVPSAILIRHYLDPQFILTDTQVLSKGLLFTAICQICLFYNDLYTFKNSIYKWEHSKRLIQAIGAAGIIVTGVTFLFREALIGRGIFITSLVICPLFLLSWRYLYGVFLENSFLNNRVVIVGSGALAKEIENEIVSNKSLGFQVAGFIDEYPGERDKARMDPKGIRDYAQLFQIARNENIDQIIVALSERRGTLPVNELLKCKMLGIKIEDGISFFEKITGKVDLDDLKPSWLIYSDGFKINNLTKAVKRSLDIFFSGLGLIFSIPLFLIIPLLIRLDSPGPVFFRQERIGENGRLFNLFKFRSMRVDAESKTGPVWAMNNDPRVTRIGKIMRKTRMDEVPQLINVLKGEMSFVGPRPERPSFVATLNQEIPYYPLRHSIKPGITGWAQIKYPYGSSVRDAFEKLKFDLYYIKNTSVYLDIAIIFSTIKVVLSARGAR